MVYNKFNKYIFKNIHFDVIIDQYIWKYGRYYTLKQTIQETNSCIILSKRDIEYYGYTFNYDIKLHSDNNDDTNQNYMRQEYNLYLWAFNFDAIDLQILLCNLFINIYHPYNYPNLLNLIRTSKHLNKNAYNLFRKIYKQYLKIEKRKLINRHGYKKKITDSEKMSYIYGL